MSIYFTLLCINILFQSHIFLCRFMDFRFVEIGAGHNWLRWSGSRYPDGMSWCSSIACSMCSHGTCTLNQNMQSRNIRTYRRYMLIPIGRRIVPSPCWTRYRTAHARHPGLIRDVNKHTWKHRCDLETISVFKKTKSIAISISDCNVHC